MNNKTPVALLLNDIHISKDNILEFHKNWDEALQICKNKGIVEMIIGGDLWLSRSSQTLDVLMAVRQAIVKATQQGIFLTIAEGNHCKVDQESVLGYSHIFSLYPNVLVVDYYTVIELSKNTELYVMSYFPENGSFTKLLKKIESTDLNKEKTNVLYIHQGIRGGLATPSEDELPASIFKSFDSVLVGHYHNRKKLEGTNIEYIGASRQHNFGEDEEKGYTVLFNDGTNEFIKNQVNVRYKVIPLNAQDIQNAPMSLLDPNTNYKLKACVHCSSEEASTIDKKQLVGMGFTKVELITTNIENTAIASHDLEHKFDKNGIKEEYTIFCADKGITVTMGLQYLDKIN